MLEQRIKERARALGFDLVGITTPDPPPHVTFYGDWLAAGHHGEMGYLATERAIERRSDPKKILPECKAIIVVATNYYAPPSTPHAPPGQGRVARYAWGADYHDVLPRKLRELVAFVEAKAGHPVKHKIYTDTGPILERDLAQRAGLGWIGKNTMLINPQIGSWTLLGEILLDLELEPDPPFEPDRCGSCTRCIDACPTDAILDGRTLDARRCISYLTIELKGEIPEGVSSEIGDWVFGCDVCQEVCPWNVRFAEASRLKGATTELVPRPGQASLVLDELLRMTDDEFRAQFGGTPLARPKRRGLARNAEIVVSHQSSVASLTTDDFSSILPIDPKPPPGSGGSRRRLARRGSA